MLNKVMLIGRLGQDPKLNEKQNCVRFSIATNKKVNGEQVSQWHNCTAFAKTMEIVCQFYKKGDLVYVEGEIEHRQYEKDGETKNMTNIIVRSTYNLTPRNNNSHEEENTSFDEEETRKAAGALGVKPTSQPEHRVVKQKSERIEDDLPF